MSEATKNDVDTTAADTQPEEEKSWETQCEDAKTNYFIIKNTIDTREEPKGALKDLSEFIAKVVEDPTSIEGNKEFKDFFYQDCALGLLKRLHKERSADPDYLEVIADVIRSFTKLFVKKIDDPDLAEAMKNVFDCNCILHTLHYEDTESEMRLLEQKKQEKWRHELKINDKIDLLKGDEKHKCWGVGIVREINEDKLEIEAENDSSAYDKIVSRFSGDIAPLGEYSNEFQWKETIAVGDEIDAFDKAKVWYPSTVLDIQEHTDPYGRKWQVLKVGFRLYHEEALKTDDEGRKYEGWSARFDEWLPLWSPKIAKLYSRAKPKQGKGTRYLEEAVIDDSVDTPVKEGEEMVYAVVRPRKCKSYLLVEVLNTFGRLGGYDRLLEIMTNKENPVDFDLLAHYMDCLGKVYPMYHRDFVSTFAVDIQNAVQSSILNAPEASIRNVRKEKIESIVSRLEDILKRKYSYDEKEKQISLLTMDITLMCLKSNFLERRIHGIKSLADTLKSLKYVNRTSKLSPEFMLEWINKNNILEVIFDQKNYHVQIIQRSKEILKFLIVENQLTEEQLNLFWRGTEFDDETRREMYKIIEEASTPMQPHHVMQFLNKITSEKDAKIIPEAVNCVYEMGKYTKDSSETSQAIVNLLWRFATDQQNPLDVSNTAITKLADLLKKWKFSTAKTYFYKCLDNLKNHNAEIESIKILKRIFRDVEYPLTSYRNAHDMVESREKEGEDKAANLEEDKKEEPSDGIVNTSSCILHFIENESILQVFLDNFKHYSQKTQDSYDKVKDKSKVKEHVFDGRYDHQTNIKERLEFLKFLASYSTFTISRKEVNIIWNLLIDESEIDYDEEAMYKWLKESCETSSGPSNVWELEDIGELFNERFSKGANEMSTLTLDGFCCIQSYFLLANETSHKLQRIKKTKPSATGGMTSYSNSTGAQFSSFSFNRLKKKPEEVPEEDSFRVFVEPSKLEGISNIWKIIIECQNQKVQEKSISFLIQLYHDLAPDIEKMKKEVNYECLETALGYLKSIQENPDKSEDTKSKQITSVLKVFTEFLAQSERKGTTGLKQQRSLLKGELLGKIQVTNSVSFNKLIPRKLELALYSNSTVYDIKRVIGAINDLPAEYVRLIRHATTTEIKDIDNGKTLAELSFKANETLLATKRNMGNIPKAPLMNPDKTLTKDAIRIFSEWFEQFSTDGLMTPEDCVEFIRSCTDDKCKTTDGRVKGLFANHDYDNDGKVDLQGFLDFYRKSCLQKEEVVRNNILAHNYRNDLKKISDTIEENTDKTVLPRYILSHEQKYFDALFSLLDRPDESSMEAWNLIQKLVTNPRLQTKILTLNVEKNQEGEYDWDTLIDTKSIFKLLYMFQIIESLIEEGGDNANEIVRVYKNREAADAKPAGPQTGKKQEDEEEEKQKQKEADMDKNRVTEFLVSDLLASNSKDKEETLKQESENRELKKNWIFNFLEKKGFEFSYDLFSKYQTDITKMNSFQKNFLGFLLKILRVFITSAFLAVEPEVASIVNLVKKQSTVKPTQETTEQNENTWDVTSDNDEENIYSTPTNRRSRSRRIMVNNEMVPIIENFMTVGSDIPVTEADLFDIDSDKANTSVEDIPMDKNLSKVSERSQVDAVDKKIEQLAQQLKGDIGNRMLNVIDFDQLQLIVLRSVASLIAQDEIDFDEKKIIENSLSLWLGCILHNPQILDNFFTFSCNEFSDVKSFMLRGILYPSLFKVREEFLHTLFLFATKIQNAKVDTFEYTLQAMLDKLPKDSEGQESCTAQYFELVSKLIEEYFVRIKDGKVEKDVLDAPKFFADVIEKIKSHTSREVRNSNKQDETLIGYLKIAHMVLDQGGLGECVDIAIEKGFITELFQKCLFPNNLAPGDEDVTEGTDLAASLIVGNKCKTEASRKWAYKLLWTLCNNSLKLLNELIVKQMQPLCSQIKLHPGWLYTPSGDTRKGKYSGIRNLGCICYMNSMLQQLYHVPAFRYQLLEVDDGAAPDWQEYKGKTIDDNVLHQLQRLFGHLELSERVDYNPYAFCFSFKQMDGQPTNTSVQHDTEEFFNILFDRIENIIKPTPQKYLLQSIFGGKNCSQMVCKECGFIRNRFEDFYNLSLTVKERKSVEESLKKNLEGEVISDYECPGCKKKVDITKRTLFSKTPNVFVIQLQRIIFDFDTFQNQKVNTAFEFPETLDLTPYSLNHIMKSEGKLSEEELNNLGEASPAKKDNEFDEDADDEYEGMTEEEKQERIEEKKTYNTFIQQNESECYEYKLVGVIIHVGTADAGHYYSYINTDRFQKNNEEDDEWLDTSKDKWMEFNDSRVSNYNFEDFKSDCYGGSSGNDDWFGGMFKTSSYGKSAYLLVYEKRFKKPVKILIPEEEGKAADLSTVPENAVVETDPTNNEKYYNVDMKDIKMFVPNGIYKEIWEDNLEFSFEKLIYSPEFYDFVKELMSGTLTFREKQDSLPVEDQKHVDEVISNMTIVGHKIAMEVLVKAYHNYKLTGLADILIKLYEASDQAVMTAMDKLLANENGNTLLYVFQVLLGCNDKISRANTSKLTSVIVNRCFELEKDILDETETVKIEVENEEEGVIGDTTTEERPKTIEREITRPKSKAVRFWDLAVSALKEKGPTNWSKFEHMLALIKNIAIGGEKQLNFIIKRNGVTDFVDFILGQNSPNYKPGEKRTKMGSAYAVPNFGPLLEAVGHMVVRCYTPNFTKDSENIPSTFNAEASEHYELSEEQIKDYFTHEEFLKIAVLNSSDILGQAISHISYKNIEVSKAIGKVILKTINTSDYEKIQNCMVIAKPYLYIEDEFQQNRVEWILGFSCLISVKTGREETTLPRFGVSCLNQPNEEVYQYLSPLDLTKKDHSLLALLWRYRGKMDLYVVNCLNILLEMIVGSQFLMEYMFNLDPPTYNFARFTDWFRPYLQKECEKTGRTITYRMSGKKEESIKKCFGYLEKYDACLKKYERRLQGLPEEEEKEAVPAESTEENKEEQKEEQKEETKKAEDDEDNDKVITAYPQRYIINCTTKLEEIHKEERDGFTVTLMKCYAEYAESQPTLNNNKTLTSYACYNAREEAAEYDRKAYQAHLAESGINAQEEDDDKPREHVSHFDDEPIRVNKPSPQDGDEEKSDWNLPKKEGDVILLAAVESSHTKSFNFRMRLVCDDDLAKENIKTPINEIESNCTALFNGLWICVQKVYPEKDWGKFHVEWSAEERKMEYSRGRVLLPSSGRGDMDDYSHMGSGMGSVHFGYHGF